MGNVLSLGVQVLGRRFLVNEDGDVWGIKPNGNLKLIPNIASSKISYNHIQCGKKKLYRHRLIAYTFLGLDFKNPKQQWHFDNIQRDKIKNQWALDNGYQLLRFWEHDIKTNRFDVVKNLMEIIK
jgi:hypothetical protein